jgi:hypothetical protein
MARDGRSDLDRPLAPTAAQEEIHYKSAHEMDQPASHTHAMTINIISHLDNMMQPTTKKGDHR